MNTYTFTTDELSKVEAYDNYSSNKAFSGVDIVAYVTLPGKKSYVLGTLNMLSISSHRDKFPVTALGKIRVRGFTGGHRTVGGTLVFATFDRTVWSRMILAADEWKDKRPQNIDPRVTKNTPLNMFLPDELPPFDITVSFVNEAGAISYTGVLGVTILDEGETYSIDNIAVMETYSYMAVDRIPFQPIGSGSFSWDTMNNSIPGTNLNFTPIGGEPEFPPGAIDSSNWRV